MAQEFGPMFQFMRLVRDMKVDDLAKKLKLEPRILVSLARGETYPSPSLERRIRVVLGWPKEVDGLIETIVQATYKSGEEQ